MGQVGCIIGLLINDLFLFNILYICEIELDKTTLHLLNTVYVLLLKLKVLYLRHCQPAARISPPNLKLQHHWHNLQYLYNNRCLHFGKQNELLSIYQHSFFLQKTIKLEDM